MLEETGRSVRLVGRWEKWRLVSFERMVGQVERRAAADLLALVAGACTTVHSTKPMDTHKTSNAMLLRI